MVIRPLFETFKKQGVKSSSRERRDEMRMTTRAPERQKQREKGGGSAHPIWRLRKKQYTIWGLALDTYSIHKQKNKGYPIPLQIRDAQI